MNTVASNHSRRQFLKTTVIATGGLLGSGLIVGCAVMPGSGAKAAEIEAGTSVSMDVTHGKAG